MKQRKTIFYSILGLILSFSLAMEGYGQGKKIEKSYRWSYQVNKDVTFDFNNYDCDLVIHTWDKAELSYVMSVDADLRTEDDAKRLDAYIEDLEFTHAASSIKFNNRFWNSKKSVMGKKTIGLKGERTIRFVEFKMKGELWVPENCVLLLSSKYSEIQVDDLNGRIDLDLYNDKIYGKNVNGNMKLSAKYSTLEFDQMKNIEADLYNSTLEAGDMGSLRVVSKYSRLQAGHAGKVDIDAYSDKYNFESTGDIRFIDKYSDLISQRSGHTELDCYNSTVNIASLDDVELKSKYGNYEFEEVQNLRVSTAYSDNITIDYLKTLNLTESKYGVYKIGYLDNSLFLGDGYSDKFFIDESGMLKGVKVSGKYVTLELGIPKELSFKFQADVKYPKFNLNEESMDVRRKIKEGSQLEMEAYRGPQTEGMPSFFVNGYEMSVTLSEQ
jgi:hypothetical protein